MIRALLFAFIWAALLALVACGAEPEQHEEGSPTMIPFATEILYRLTNTENKPLKVPSDAEAFEVLASGEGIINELIVAKDADLAAASVVLRMYLSPECGTARSGLMKAPAAGTLYFNPTSPYITAHVTFYRRGS